MNRTLTMGATEWLLLLLLSVLWGGSFFFSKLALAELRPFTIVFARVAIAAVALYVYLRLTGRKAPVGAATWRTLFVMGLINNLIPFSLLFYGQTAIASGLAAILNATTPVFSILVAHATTKDERMTGSKITGVLLALLGVVILIGPEALARQNQSVTGMLACVLAAVSYGCASVFGRRFRIMGVEPVQVAFGQVSATTVMMLPVVLLVDAPWRLAAPHAVTWAAVAALGLVSTGFAYVLFFRILAVAGATNVALVTCLVPVSAILLGTAILGERLAANALIGMVVIVAGLVAIDGRIWHKIGLGPARGEAT